MRASRTTKAILTDGRHSQTVIRHVKSTVDPWDIESHPEAWVGLPRPANASQLVPAVYSAWQTRCKAMADLPFSIYGKGDKKVDDSDDYKNTTKLLENPRHFLWLTEAAFVGYGKCYWLKRPNQFAITRGLQYVRPDLVDAKFTSEEGLVGFERHASAVTEHYAPDEVLYLWLPDPAVEIGPPTMFPLASALLTAGALEKINSFVYDFMDRGAVKAMLLALKDVPNVDEVNRMEKWWNRFMRGFSDEWHVVNADNVTPTVVGDGLDAFRGITVTENLIDQVNTALGTRHLLEDENYATAQIRQREFYSNTVMPDARVISDALNEQVLAEKGYRIEFEPERLECFQQDEAELTANLAQLLAALMQGGMSGGIALTLAMELLGFELTPDQKAQMKEGIAKGEEEKEKNRELMMQQGGGFGGGGGGNKWGGKEEEKARWQRKAVGSFNKGRGADVEFYSGLLTKEEITGIRSRLADCKSTDEIKAVFNLPPYQLPTTAKENQ